MFGVVVMWCEQIKKFALIKLFVHVSTQQSHTNILSHNKIKGGETPIEN